jgi:hypothetical protein
MNIVDVIKGQFSPDVLGKLSSVLGEGEDKTKTTLGAVVPGLLSLLSSLASTGGGAEKLANALKQVDPGTDGNLGEILSGKDLPSIQEKGMGWLSSLLGSAALPVIISILGKFAGVGAGQLKGLMGMLAPFLLSMIAKQMSGKPLTSQTVSSFFQEQKSNIGAAMPSGLSFADAPGLGSLSGAAQSATAAARSTAAAAREEAAGMPSWLVPLLGLVVVGGLAWYFLGGPGAVAPPEPEKAKVSGTTAATPKPPAEAPKPIDEAPKLPVAPKAEALADVASLTKDLGSAYSSLAEILGGVKDAPTAGAALPKLTDLVPKVDGFKAIFDKLNDAGKAAIAKVTAEHLGKFKDLADTVLKVPGLPDKFKEILQVILTKLTSFNVA